MWPRRPSPGPDAARKRPLRSLLHLAGPYWNCERRRKVRGATLLLLLLTLAQVGLTVWGNYWNRALFDALEQRTVHGVIVQVGVFALIFLISIAVTAAHLMVKRWLQLDWRAWLTERLVGRWLDQGRHYRLQFSDGEHDNPDQRIAEDIRIATETAIALAHTLVFSVLILALFVDILWSVSGSIAVPGTEVEVPGYMVPLAFLYALVGGVIGWLIARPLVGATNALQTAEATFRFGLSRAREHTEAIALMRAEPLERTGSAIRFRQLAHDWDRQSFAYLGLVSFSTAYGALLPVFPILVAAPQYIAGAMTLGALMQAAQAFQRLTSALSWPIDSLGEIARCRASADRVLALYEDMSRIDAPAGPSDGPRIMVGKSADGRLLFERLSITEPSGLLLLDEFDASITPGERVLVTGDSAVTGPLFKVLGGLWPWGSGQLSLPAGSGLMLVPQRPFLPEGTLRAALCYPLDERSCSDTEIRHALDCAGLGWLAPRLDETDNWEQVLPLQTQQRLGLARVVLKQPAWIVTEQATDAFDPDGERRMFDMLRRELPQASLVTISLHTRLAEFHQRTLHVNRVRDRRFVSEGLPAAAH